MTIDADEIARLRANLDKGFRPTRRESLALLDELEKARTEGQRQYDYNVGQIAKFAAVEAERDRLAVLLRESKKCVEQYAEESGHKALIDLRARISAELGDKP